MRGRKLRGGGRWEERERGERGLELMDILRDRVSEVGERERKLRVSGTEWAPGGLYARAY